jgi:hypothetical protein
MTAPLTALLPLSAGLRGTLQQGIAHRTIRITIRPSKPPPSHCLDELTRRCLSIHFLVMQCNTDIVLDIQSPTRVAFIPPVGRPHWNVSRHQ